MAWLTALREEHVPQEPTKVHLGEELAGIIWRKRRLRLAEAATHRDGLRRTMKSYSDTASSALAHLHGGETTDESGRQSATRPDLKEALRGLKADEAMTRRRWS